MHTRCSFDRAISVKKLLLSVTLISLLTLSACTEEEITEFFGGNTVKFTISGKTFNISNTAEPDVTVEGVHGEPGDTSNPATSSDDNGDFSLQVTENDSFYLHASKSGFVTMNTKRTGLSSDETAIVIEMPSETEAQDIIDAALYALFFNHAWLTVDVLTTDDAEANNQVISLSPAPVSAVYTDCDGSDSLASETTGAPCATDRPGPMFIAYYDYNGEVIVTVGDESQTAPIRMGEMTALQFKLP